MNYFSSGKRAYPRMMAWAVCFKQPPRQSIAPDHARPGLWRSAELCRPYSNRSGICSFWGSRSQIQACPNTDDERAGSSQIILFEGRGPSLYACTQGSAYAEFAEKHKGKLLPGYDADFILVDRDLYKVDAAAILARWC